MAGILGRCSLAAGSAPYGCDWCGRRLVGRQSRWCGPLCVAAYRKNHLWLYARPAAIRRDGDVCVRCGGHDGLEVNHIVPLGSVVDFDGERGADKRGRESCLHHLDGLETLCHDCHVGVTRQQRADGLI